MSQNIQSKSLEKNIIYFGEKYWSPDIIFLKYMEKKEEKKILDLKKEIEMIKNKFLKE